MSTDPYPDGYRAGYQRGQTDREDLAARLTNIRCLIDAFHAVWGPGHGPTAALLDQIADQAGVAS